jgi:hypothetical protein
VSVSYPCQFGEKQPSKDLDWRAFYLQIHAEDSMIDNGRQDGFLCYFFGLIYLWYESYLFEIVFGRKLLHFLNIDLKDMLKTVLPQPSHVMMIDIILLYVKIQNR